VKLFMQPLLAMIAGVTESELPGYVEYLEVENQIPWDRLRIDRLSSCGFMNP